MFCPDCGEPIFPGRLDIRNCAPRSRRGSRRAGEQASRSERSSPSNDRYRDEETVPGMTAYGAQSRRTSKICSMSAFGSIAAGPLLGRAAHAEGGR